MLCRSEEHFKWSELFPMFQEKCRIRNIKPETSGLVSAQLKEWNKNAWRDRLGPMLKDLPDFEQVWVEWTETLSIMMGDKK
jgi:hypothetical protein